jgi:hypothetical protein
MKEFFARLNPTERRFVVGVGVVFFLVVNIVWVWPHFGDWSDTKGRMAAARTRLVTFESGTNLIPELQKKIGQHQGQGQIVPEENQALQFSRLVMSQTTLFGIIPQNTSIRREAGPTNSFFVEQSATMTVDTTEKQLVDFLYSIGAGTNLTRVKVLSVQPDPSHSRLSTRVTLVASYQKQNIGPAPAAQKPAATAQKPAATPAAAQQKPAATPNKPGPATQPPNNAKAIPGVPMPNRLQVTNRTGIPGAPKNLTPNKK